MTKHLTKETTIEFTSRGVSLFVLATLLALTGTSSPAKDHHRQGNRYRQINLVSDQPDVALVQDEHLINAWGISFGPTSPFWVSANGSGRATIYAVTNDADGATQVVKQGLEVTIPGNVTGQVFNNVGGFNGDVFLFVSEDGTIAGWRPPLGTEAETLAARPTAVYKGIALAATDIGPMLLAANFSEGTIDAYGTNMALIGQFSDPLAPAGYAPFNVQSVGGVIYVTFAKQDDDKEDDVAGPGNGLIDVFDARTGRFDRFVTGSDAGGKLRAINSPWGLAIAPDSFGKHAGELLVANFGSGTIMAFDRKGRFRGLLQGENHRPIAIEGLWGISIGNGARAGVPDTLYFTAGPAEESHGLFGSIEPVRAHDRDDDQGDDDDHDQDND